MLTYALAPHGRCQRMPNEAWFLVGWQCKWNSEGPPGCHTPPQEVSVYFLALNFPHKIYVFPHKIYVFINITCASINQHHTPLYNRFTVYEQIPFILPIKPLKMPVQCKTLQKTRKRPPPTNECKEKQIGNIWSSQVSSRDGKTVSVASNGQQQWR